ncbi:MAG: hypothetical protein QM831_21050 [Kofleriaceae bacterium]
MKRWLWLVALAGCDKGQHRVIDDDKLDTDRTRTIHKQFEALAVQMRKMWAEKKAFPIGVSAKLPKQRDLECCGVDPATGKNTLQCPPDPDFKTDPMWSKLEFSIDEPSFYRFEYHGTNASVFTVFATGDVDCDRVSVEFTMGGVVEPDGKLKLWAWQQQPLDEF